MPKIHVVKSKIINAPVSKVYDIVSDLRTWTAWSPWLIMEPDATVNMEDGGKFYSWDGERVGSGNLRVIREDKNKRVDFDLTFLKPWKSTAKTWMTVSEKDGGTELSWFMDSSLPFFMFFMKKMMIAFIGMDYERGLNLLKDYAEDGKVHSQIEFTGESEYAGGPYIGLKKTISMDEIADVMTADFTQLGQWAGENQDNAKDLICIYYKYDFVKGVVSYTAAITCHETPSDLLDGFISGMQQGGRIHSVTHTGPYHHLGNAWSTAHNMIRSKEIRPVKGQHPFELYENSPMDTDELDLRTRISFLVK